MGAANSAIKVLDENPSRAGLMFYNNTGNSLYLVFGEALLGGDCNAIIASFQNYSMLSPGAVYKGAIWASRNTGTTGTLNIVEFIEDPSNADFVRIF